MRSFRYVFDPLFVASLATYTINRFVLKPNFSTPFLHDHLNDLLCIPLWVPIGLFIERRLKLRMHDRPPELLEILVPLVIWAWVFEVLLPANDLGRSWCTPDPADVAYYILGALGATLFWNRSSFTREPTERGHPGSVSTLSKFGACTVARRRTFLYILRDGDLSIAVGVVSSGV